jgi:Ca-activated chloride channel homolog
MKRLPRTLAGTMCVMVLSLFPVAGAAQDVVELDKTFAVSVDVQLVELPVSVLDKDGHPVSGLQKTHFKVYENGVLQEISLFKREDIPLSVGLVIDSSGSMSNKRDKVRSAALAFASESNPEDETFVVTFNNDAYLEQDFTRSVQDLARALRRLGSRGATALYDAMYLSADHVRRGSKDKKVLLVISDGEDNRSQFSLERVLAKMRATQATVYTIGLLDQNDRRGGLFKKSPSAKAKQILQQVAAMSGGRAYFPKSIDEIVVLCRQIARDLRNQYTLGYTPSNAKTDGSWRRITVRLDPPKGLPRVTLRAKEGYYAPLPQQTSLR